MEDLDMCEVTASGTMCNCERISPVGLFATRTSYYIQGLLL